MSFCVRLNRCSLHLLVFVAGFFFFVFFLQCSFVSFRLYLPNYPHFIWFWIAFACTKFRVQKSTIILCVCVCAFSFQTTAHIHASDKVCAVLLVWHPFTTYLPFVRAFILWVYRTNIFLLSCYIWRPTKLIRCINSHAHVRVSSRKNNWFQLCDCYKMVCKMYVLRWFWPSGVCEWEEKKWKISREKRIYLKHSGEKVRSIRVRSRIAEILC